ncbi:MAG: DNA mismatch repair endonuclease MutL [Acutalibacteraceae bacterium]|nr:DNA mismatch repair endonuclease MutL [Acutalibacteraceae bacterium]
MPTINVLPRAIAELIAAGEVVERPASVVKEMVENSIDAGATHITVEISRGGITYIRVTDDGCGIESADVKKAFLRHATSKIRVADDLDGIATLVFRGEALAATSAVARVEMFTKSANEPLGTHYLIEGGEETLCEESGCPNGTTLVVRDLFFNTPARMKFLKKDATEAAAVKAIVDRAALSNPQISFKLIRDGEQIFTTSGNGDLMGAIYSVMGREYANSLIPVGAQYDGVSVEGFICKPIACRASRAGQITFLNGRLVMSKTVMAAVEQAYKNSAMVGKFPAFVLNVKLPLEAVDVNVHPAKTEVRFSDEKRVFSAVHYAVRSAIAAGDTRPEITPATAKKPFFMHMDANEYRQTAVRLEDTPTPEKEAVKSENRPPVSRLSDNDTPLLLRKDVKETVNKMQEKAQAVYRPAVNINIDVEEEPTVTAMVPQATVQEEPKLPVKEYNPDAEVKLIGEAFSTYIIVSRGESIFLIDKHAAHERLLFNELKEKQIIESQPLLQPIAVRLDGDRYTAAIDSAELLLRVGIELEDFGDGVVLVRAVPAALKDTDIVAIIEEAATSLAKTGDVSLDALDDLFHTVSCKAAIKAGFITSDAELLSLAKKVIDNSEVMYCPHGRPVAFEIKRRELERHFGRIQ